jgi:hypothetical protein
MDRCSTCGEAVTAAEAVPVLRSEAGLYHLPCAPAALVVSAAEEYQAILRKGVRYFVEKYGASPSGPQDLGGSFLRLGRAVEAEAQRRATAPSPARGEPERT